MDLSSLSAQDLQQGYSIVEPALQSWAAAAETKAGRRWAENMMAAQQQWALEQLDKQNQFNISQWERNNAYNTPTAQRERLAAAGFNPLIASGDSGISNSPVTSVGQPPQTDIAGIQQAANQRSLISSQIAANYAQTRNLEASAKLAEEKATSESTLRNSIKAMYDSETEVNGVKVKLLGAETYLTEQQAEVAKASVDKISVETANAQKEGVLLDLAKSEKEIELKHLEPKLKAEISEIISRERLNNANANTAYEYAKLILEQTEEQRIQNKTAKMQYNTATLEYLITLKGVPSRCRIIQREGQEAQIFLESSKWTKSVGQEFANLALAFRAVTGTMAAGASVAATVAAIPK